jgi:valyl-tRNA synthetase
MDTWATSSLSPLIVCGWERDPDLFARTFPMDMRPQAHEIIRTWLFYAVLRSHLEHDALPWRHAAISGWILDPDRKKMSKSVGNVVTPMDPLRQHGSDAVRYWAASGRLGADMTFDLGQLRVGRRLATKILNASRFILTLPPPEPATEPPAAAAVTEPLDRAMLSRLGGVVSTCTAAFDAYDHARALETVEEFFWFFCDDYVELVKSRGYGEQGGPAAQSAIAALRLALSTLLRLFAPFLPFVTEEVWSWWQEGSVHRAGWPVADEVAALAPGAHAAVLRDASVVLAGVRKAKSEAKTSMRTEVAAATVTGPQEALDRVAEAAADLQATGRIGDLALQASDQPLEVTVTL